MQPISSFFWRCPSCSLALNYCDGAWTCENKHSFDKAKEGYVNLLLAQHRNSKEPGDSKAMITARRRFLSEGYYQPLMDEIVAVLVKHTQARVQSKPLSQENTLSLFDAGCGEGQYLNAIFSGLVNQGITPRVSGVDISKPAVQKAAKLLKQGQFAVASTYSVPLCSATQDAVVQVFAPSSEQEIHRILDDQGLWIKVSPGPEHLFELKQKVYDTPERHTVDTLVPSGFTLLETKSLTFPMNLSSPEIREALLMMTPFYWQISETKKDALLASLMSLTADFHIQLFSKALPNTGL